MSDSASPDRARAAAADLRQFLGGRATLTDDCRTAINQAFLSFATSERAAWEAEKREAVEAAEAKEREVHNLTTCPCIAAQRYVPGCSQHSRTRSPNNAG